MASTRIFKNKWFVRFAAAEGIDDLTLCRAIARAEEGLVDADLGGGVVKLRIARAGEGSSGGYRSIVCFRQGDKAFFVFGFAKSRQANIKRDELAAFRKLAKELLALDDDRIGRLAKASALVEVKRDG